MRKKSYFAAILLAAALTGCSGQTAQPTQEVMPQNVPSDITAAQTAAETETEAMTEAVTESAAEAAVSAPAGTEAAAPAVSGTSASSAEETPEELLGRLYLVKAEEEALDVEEDLLEADVRTGKLTREEFLQKEMELEQKEDALDLSEDEIELALKKQFWTSGSLLPEDFAASLESMELEELLNLLRENELEEDKNELEEDRLKMQYLNGEITREAFLTAQAELERASDLLEAKEDMIEYRLKLLGWDD